MTPHEICQDFANRLKLVFEDKGECGFGRECVGFQAGGQWLAFDPIRAPDYRPIAGLQCPAVGRHSPPDAYHKHDCLAVLGRGKKAVKQLADWVKGIESEGEPYIATFETGARDIISVALHGLTQKCLMVRPASAIEAAAAGETTEIGSTEGESAARDSGDAQTTPQPPGASQ